MPKVKSLALCGIFAGLTLALMWVFSFVPSMDYALPAAAGVLTLLLVAELGASWALGVYLAAGTLSVLLLPGRGAALFYAMFFGYYPILKSVLERRLPAALAWLCKFAVFNAAGIASYTLATRVFGIDLSDFGPAFAQYAEAFMLGVGNLAFWMYDFMILSTFLQLYRRRWQKRLRRLMGRDGSMNN